MMLTYIFMAKSSSFSPLVIVLLILLFLAVSVLTAYITIKSKLNSLKQNKQNDDDEENKNI